MLASERMELRNDMLQKINSVYEFLVKTTVIAHQESYTEETFAEELRKSNHFYTAGSVDRLAKMYALSKLEESFANEITWIYFVNFSGDNYMINNQSGRSSLVRNELLFDKDLLLASGKLFILVNGDQEIKSLISNIIDDIELYQAKSLGKVQLLKSKLVN